LIGIASDASDCDADLAVLDLDVVRLELDGAVELVLAGPDVVLPAVPGAAEDMAFEPALAERSLQMEAMALNRVHLAVDPGERELDVVDLHAGKRAWMDLVDAGDRLETILFHTLDPNVVRCYL